MKKIPSLCGLLTAFILLLSACSKSKSGAPAEEPMKLSADKNALNYEREGAEQIINLVSNAEWKAELSANAAWLSLDKTGGSTSTALKITSATNTALAGRTATLTLKSAGVPDVVVTIAQKGLIAWEKNIDVTKGTNSTFKDVIVVNDGFVVVGRKNTGFYIAKLSPDGQTVLKENTLAEHMEGTAMVMNNDGSFVVTGITSAGTNSGGGNIFAIKLDANFQPVPGKFFLLDNRNQDFPTSIIKTSDNKYVITGYKNGSMYAVKLDQDLQMVPGHEFIHFTTDPTCIAYGIVETADGGFAVAGTSYDNGNLNIHMLKLDANFAYVPARSYVIDQSASDYVTSIKPTSDGGFVLIGSVYLNARTNTYVQKLDANVQRVSGKKLIFNKEVHTGATGIIENAGQGFTLVNYLYNNETTDRDIFVNYLDQNLQLIPGKEFRIDRKQSDLIYGVFATTDGGFVLSGSVYDMNSASLYLARFNK